MSNDVVLMQFNGDAPGLYNTETMPSGQVYQYSSMAGRNMILALPMDVKKLQELGFAKVGAEKAEERRLEVVDSVEETTSADDPKTNRRK